MRRHDAMLSRSTGRQAPRPVQGPINCQDSALQVINFQIRALLMHMKFP